MSEENLEALVRRGVDAINRRDFDLLLALADPEVVGEPRIAGTEGAAYRGHDGLRSWWENIFAVFPDFTLEVLDVQTHGDWTITKVHGRGTGASSDAPFQQTAWQVVEWRDAKCVWLHTYESESEALEATGVSE